MTRLITYIVIIFKNTNYIGKEDSSLFSNRSKFLVYVSKNSQRKWYTGFPFSIYTMSTHFIQSTVCITHVQYQSQVGANTALFQCIA